MRAPPASEIAYALYGAWRLLRRDTSAVQHFRTDAQGFWNSFFAAVIVAPGYAVLVALHLSGGGASADWASTFLIHTETYAITWLAFPLAMFYLSAGLQRPERWVPFVVAFNWSKVIQLVIYLPLSGFAAVGLGGPQGAALITLVALAIVLLYQWYVTKTVLQVDGLQAGGLTALDFVLGLFITSAADAALA
jgi:hypothetical protein